MSQEDFAFGNFVCFEEFVVLKSVAHRLLVNEDIGDQRVALQFCGGGAKAFQSGLELGAIGLRDIDSGRWNGLSRCRSLRLGRSESGEQETAVQHLHTCEPLSYSREPRLTEGMVLIYWSSPQAERWQSGRSRPPRKREYLYGYREFESPPLRQLSKFASFSSKLLETNTVAEFDSCKFANGFLNDIRNSPPFQKASSEIKP